ncbi:hypothetical protein [Halorhabdus salina]|uniref:hypothetical protein n=1 Tax=Halorhabdus salina TaxID=2750670 RepID=UPI0015EF3C81|nr:hypothetical protein [Halorhabdus salina]
MATADPEWLHFEGSPFEEDTFRNVWLLALATYGVGDIVTTITIVYFSEIHVEANPIVNASIDAFGGGGFLAMKLLVLYTCLGISIWAGRLENDRLLFYGPPLLLMLVGLLITGTNLMILFAAA